MLFGREKFMDKFKQMTETPVSRLVTRLAIPTMISMLVTTFYNMADTYFVSRLNNTSATGAVGVVFPLMSLIQAFGFLFGNGSGNCISRLLGAGEKEKAEKMASFAFYSGIAVGLLITVSGFVTLKPLAYILGATKTIYPYARDYLAIILLGAPFVCGAMVLNNQLRFQGNASFAMIGVSSGAVLNCVLDPLLIETAGFGIAGAAAATTISQIVSFVLLVIGIKYSKGVKPIIKNFTVEKEYVLGVINGGAPSLARQGIASFSAVILNLIGGAFGDYAITAMTVCSKITMFLNSAMIGFGQGFQPVCGFNYGAKRYDRVKKAFWFSTYVTFVFLLVMSVVGFVFAKPLVGFFTDDPKVLSFGVPAFRFMCISFPVNSFTVMSNMAMQTVGHAVRATLIAISRQGIAYIPTVFVLWNFFGETGFQISQMCADFITFLIAIPLQMSLLKELNKNPLKEGDNGV